MEVTVKERLIQYLKKKGIGRNKFEKAAGISIGYISNLKSSPGADILVKILNAAPDLNRVWLLTGEGEMLNGSDVSLVPDTTMDEYTITKSGNKFMKRSDGKLFIDVPVAPISALGSPEDEWAEIINDETLERELFQVDAVHHGHYWSFRVEGNSMDDGSRGAYQAGDVVLVRELPRDEWAPKLHINDWPFWVVVWDNCVRIKQIIAQDTEAGTITLHSLNPSPEYTDFTLPLSRVSHLFNVVRHKLKDIVYK